MNGMQNGMNPGTGNGMNGMQNGMNPGMGNGMNGMQNGMNGMQGGYQSLQQKLYQNAQQWFQDNVQRFQQIKQAIPNLTYDRIAENKRQQAVNQASQIENYINTAQQWMRNEYQAEGFMRYQEARLINLARSILPLTVKVFRCGINTNQIDCSSA